MARSHLPTAFVAIAILLLATLHLADRLDLTWRYGWLFHTADEVNKHGRANSAYLNEGARTSYLLGVGKADITGYRSLERHTIKNGFNADIVPQDPWWSST